MIYRRPDQYTIVENLSNCLVSNTTQGSRCKIPTLWDTCQFIMPLKFCKLTLAFLATCGQIKAHTSDVIPAGDSNITEKYNIISYNYINTCTMYFRSITLSFLTNLEGW